MHRVQSAPVRLRPSAEHGLAPTLRDDMIMAADIATRVLTTFTPLLLVCGLSGIAHGAAPAEVIVNGIALKSEQVNFLQQQYSVRVLPGRYWYDAVSGVWGVEGGPTRGQIYPGLALGGRLRADASQGNTGVFVNGRELHPNDVDGPATVYTGLPRSLLGQCARHRRDGRRTSDVQPRGAVQRSAADLERAYLAQRRRVLELSQRRDRHERHQRWARRQYSEIGRSLTRQPAALLASSGDRAFDLDVDQFRIVLSQNR